jgi:hypothetical protein
MRNKYGPHGEDVEEFLAEVEATTDPAVWDQILAQRDSGARVAAGKALVQIGLPASVDSAVDRGARLAYRSLHLTRNDLPHAFLGLSDVYDTIGDAAAALALGNRLAPEHRRTYLASFAAAGFASVLASYAWTALDQDTETGPQTSDVSPPAEG